MTVVGPTPTGYTPAQIRSYLGLTGSGSGQTIAVVSAYDAPTVTADLATFDRTFGLAAPPSFRKVDATGGTRYPRADAGWALETSLDVQWAHAVAPTSALLLVEAKSSALTDMLAALDFAAKQPGVTVISASFGVSGEFSTEAGQDGHCALSTAVCVIASGDDGNPGGYPAYNPYALAVGGTTLHLAADGSVLDETGWSGSGGGVSAVEAKPSYQGGTSFARRSIPDVSYDADPATGFAVYDSTAYQQQSGWFQLGGTSAGAPQWAGILAAADSLRAARGKGPLVGARATGFPTHAALYSSAALFDVTTGSNGPCGAICTATPGFDAVTGLGSPRRGIDSILAAAP
jgi:subtilase family serine protease